MTDLTLRLDLLVGGFLIADAGFPFVAVAPQGGG